MVDVLCEDKTVKFIQEANRYIRNDDNVDVIMLNIGDGLTIASKK